MAITMGGIRKLPIRLARLVCQRTNMRWDARLRMNVWFYYLYVLLGLCATAVAFSIAKHMTADEIMAPVAPIAFSLASKLAAQKEAATKSEEGKRDVDGVWGGAIAGDLSDEQLDERSQTLQEGLYERRLRSPQVPDWVYRRSRRRFEADMKRGAREMVEQALQARTKKRS